MAAAARAGREPPERAPRGRRAPPATGRSSPPTLDDDFNTPRRSRCSTAGRARARSTSSVAASRSSGSAVARRAVEAPEAVVALARARAEARAAGDYAESDRLRDEIAALGWEVRDDPAPPAASSSFRSRDARPRLRAQRRAGGAARPPRGTRALGLGAGGRAARLARRRAAAACRQGARADGGGRDARSPGRRRLGGPYPYADPWELAAGEAPLLACLDQVTDPRNLGAVVRSAAGAGATGVIVPAHGSAQVTPAVCRSSAGTVEHLPVAVVPNLARYLGEIKRDDLWSYAAAADAPADDVGRRPDGRRRARLRRRGQGRPSARPQDVRRRGRDPARRRRRVAQRQRRGRRAAVRGTAPALEPPETHEDCRADASTSSTATTCSTPAARRTCASSSTSSRASSPSRVRAASSSSTASARIAEVGSLTVRYAPDADTLLERLAAEHRHRRARLPRLLRRGRAGHVRARRWRRWPRARSSRSSRRRRTSRQAPRGARPARRRDARQARAAASRRSRRRVARRRLLRARTHVLITCKFAKGL